MRVAKRRGLWSGEDATGRCRRRFRPTKPAHRPVGTLHRSTPGVLAPGAAVGGNVARWPVGVGG